MKKFKNNIIALMCMTSMIFGIFGVMPLMAPYIAVTYAEDIPGPTETTEPAETTETTNTTGTAAYDDFCVVVDYYAETVRIINKDTLLAGGSDYIEIYDNTGAFMSAAAGTSDFAESISSMTEDAQYMYALKAVSNIVLDSYVKAGKPDKKVNALRNEKWYPIYGGGFNIKSAIPLKGSADPKRQYYIAVRRADDYFNTQSGYETRIAVPVKPRFNDKNLAKYLEYDAINERIILSPSYSASSLSITYRFDYFEPVSGVLSKQSGGGEGIDVPSKYFMLGGYMYISTMPFKDSDENVVSARSKEIKFKIPKAPNSPAVKADLTNKKITSLKKGIMEWSIDGISWTTYDRTETAVQFKDVFSVFAGLETSVLEENNYAIYFRIKAIEKKSPVSVPKKILIPAGYLTQT